MRAAIACSAEPSKNVCTTWAVLLVTDVALLFQDAQQRANRRIARRVLKLALHVGGGGAAALEEQIHYLPLPAAQARHE
jgi:hypothetical protein